MRLTSPVVQRRIANHIRGWPVKCPERNCKHAAAVGRCVCTVTHSCPESELCKMPRRSNTNTSDYISPSRRVSNLLIINNPTMKLIITGASGFVATEVLRQALLHPSITSIVAVARSSVSSPEGTPATSASKLKSVVVPDYGTYPDDVKEEFADADACIWYVSPSDEMSYFIFFIC